MSRRKSEKSDRMAYGEILRAKTLLQSSISSQAVAQLRIKLCFDLRMWWNRQTSMI